MAKRKSEAVADAISRATLRRARNFGWEIDRCERLLYRPGMFPLKRDLFGLFDFLAIDPVRWKVVAIQTTSRKELATHWRGYRSDEQLMERMRAWNQTSAKFELWGWAKPKHRWVLHRFEVTDEAIETGALHALDPEVPSGVAVEAPARKG